MPTESDESKKHVPEEKQNVAAILAFFLGGIGAHRFYLGQTRRGVVFLLLFWTGIPALIGLVDAVLILLKGRQLF